MDILNGCDVRSRFDTPPEDEDAPGMPAMLNEKETSLDMDDGLDSIDETLDALLDVDDAGLAGCR